MKLLKLIAPLLLGVFAYSATLDLPVKQLIGHDRALLEKGDVKKGTSALVVTKLKDGRSAIVARAVVQGESENGLNVQFIVMEDLSQDALPRSIIVPKEGDVARFYLLEERAAIIAANAQDYQKLSAKLSSLQLTHPDALAAQMAYDRKGRPQKVDFAKFCQNYSLGNLYFAVSNQLAKVDCGSFEVLSLQPFASSTETATSPFFQRIGKIETGYFGLMTESVENYDSYYSKLLGLR